MRFLTGCQKKNGESIKLEEEFFAEYDVFFYQFTRKDQSKSEEAQRAKLKAANKPPPSLPALSMNFSGLTFLLQSELMLHLMRLVLRSACREQMLQ